MCLSDSRLQSAAGDGVVVLSSSLLPFVVNSQLGACNSPQNSSDSASLGFRFLLFGLTVCACLSLQYQSLFFSRIRSTPRPVVTQGWDHTQYDVCVCVLEL